MGHPARKRVNRHKTGSRQVDQFRAWPSNGDHLKPAPGELSRGLQIQKDFPGYDPEQMMAAQAAYTGFLDRKNVDMARHDLQQSSAIIEQPGMPRVEQQTFARAGGGRVLRKFVAGQTIAHSPTTSFA
jgi:hypothetical protein